MLGYVLYMKNYDSLDYLAHAYGMTDLEIEEREAVLAEIASQQIIRRRMDEEFSENEDIDWGYHDQYDF